MGLRVSAGRGGGGRAHQWRCCWGVVLAGLLGLAAWQGVGKAATPAGGTGFVPVQRRALLGPRGWGRGRRRTRRRI